jgi:predicted O-linked N-acetylglucosamine transferase (SPINDLY family)
LEDACRLDDAIAAGNEAVKLNPRAVAGHINLANALHQKGHFSESIEHYREALRLQPDDITTLHNLANALQVAGCPDESIAAYERAIRLAPKDAAIHSDFAVPLQASGKLDEAIETCLRALEIDPDYADALNNLGVFYKDRGQLDFALESLRKAAQLSPHDARYQSNLIYATCLHPDCDGKEILEQCLEWDRRHGAPLKRLIVRHDNDPSPDRKLRIGYISPDFRNHVVSWNLLPLLREHDRETFEVFCYGDTQRPDFFTEKIRGACDHWRDILGMKDEAVAEAIRVDRIDILVDLTLHLTHNRLLVFARKPAPVQVTYLGYCGTTGLEAIDYRFSDPYLDGADADLNDYREKTVRLPRTYWCYEPGGPTPKASPLPALSDGRVTFGCLNIFPKVSTAALDLWLEILRAMPNSRLMLRAPEGFCRTELVARFAQGGVTADRLEFVGTQPWEPYLSTLQRIDIALDPFPYGGGISTCDALWMGIPVVSLIGRTAVGRGGFSILSNIGLPELAVDTPEKYVEIAVALANDIPRLNALHASLRERMERSPLRNPQGFARDVETAYREMWRGWCAQ